MTAAGKIQAERAIDQLKERGHTNLSGGLFAGFDQFFKLKPEEVARVESILLFTDGKANVGIAKTPQLEKATRYSHGTVNVSVSLDHFSA